MRLGDIIREYRIRHDMSMGDFARKSGISKPYISMLESNKNSRDGKSIVPSITTLQKVSHAVNVSLNDLLRMLDGNQNIDLKPSALDDEQIALLTGYDLLNDSGKKIIKEMMEQLNFGRNSETPHKESNYITVIGKPTVTISP